MRTPQVAVGSALFVLHKTCCFCRPATNFGCTRLLRPAHYHAQLRQQLSSRCLSSLLIHAPHALSTASGLNLASPLCTTILGADGCSLGGGRHACTDRCRHSAARISLRVAQLGSTAANRAAGCHSLHEQAQHRELPPLLLVSGAKSIPHPGKVPRCGEDAYFIAEDGLSLGVADGVGGWADRGIDAGEYARILMRKSQEAARQIAPNVLKPRQVLLSAHKQTDVKGSCTACIIVLDKGVLRAANIGDSGFMIVRSHSVIFRTPQQQHKFNFPFQLGSVKTLSDAPTAADLFSIDVRAGDVVVAGTDGLFDNVFDTESANFIASMKAEGLAPEAAATGLARLAHERAADKGNSSPFEKAAIEAGYHGFRGGKMDDITVVVSYVTET